jgi:hypothetical protein
VDANTAASADDGGDGEGSAESTGEVTDEVSGEAVDEAAGEMAAMPVTRAARRTENDTRETLYKNQQSARRFFEER